MALLDYCCSACRCVQAFRAKRFWRSRRILRKLLDQRNIVEGVASDYSDVKTPTVSPGEPVMLKNRRRRQKRMSFHLWFCRDGLDCRRASQDQNGGEMMNVREKPEQRPLAHVRQLPDGTWAEHFLDEHLQGVARLAGEFAASFESADWARLAGLWHDLGKYSETFQKYIKQVSGYVCNYDPEAHMEGTTSAINTFGAHGRILAYLITGHHAGLPDWSSADSGCKALSVRLDQAELLGRVLKQPLPPELLTQPKSTSRIPGGASGMQEIPAAAQAVLHRGIHEPAGKLL